MSQGGPWTCFENSGWSAMAMEVGTSVLRNATQRKKNTNIGRSNGQGPCSVGNRCAPARVWSSSLRPSANATHWRVNSASAGACLESSAHLKGCGARDLRSPRWMKAQIWKVKQPWGCARLLIGACLQGHGDRVFRFPPMKEWLCGQSSKAPLCKSGDSRASRDRASSLRGQFFSGNSRRP